MKKKDIYDYNKQVYKNRGNLVFKELYIGIVEYLDLYNFVVTVNGVLRYRKTARKRISYEKLERKYPVEVGDVVEIDTVTKYDLKKRKLVMNIVSVKHFEEEKKPLTKFDLLDV
tara:strand:- start:938 stop:1279 length:342 start_codon:yes stop_codon:yes gene_type:complete